MKKFVKILIIVIIVLALIIICNTVRNIFIINKIIKNESNYFSDMNSYQLKIESHYVNNLQDGEPLEETSTTEYYFKNDKLATKKYINEELENTEYADTDVIPNNNFKYTDLMKINFLIENDFSNNKIKLYLLNFITSDKDNYIIKGSEFSYYYSKETGLLSKNSKDDLRYEIYLIEKNNVDDSKVEN